MANVQAVLSALEALGQPTSDKASFINANNWLQDFQHSNEAWATCNTLLLNPEMPLLAKIFAAQTFRAKVTYDLHQLDPSFIPSLRDSLLAALGSLIGSPKTIIVQLCLAIAGLALQFPAWQITAVQSVIDKFGQNPVTVPTLLEFLTVLPEEITGNTKIPVTPDEYEDGSAKLLTANAQTVANLLTMYLTAPGVTTVVQNQIFRCLRSWVVAGEILPSMVSETPLLGFAFEALESEELFDVAVDVLCEVIHETQEVDDNMAVIQIIVPKLVQLKSKITIAQDDPERLKGLAKIFSEAGEVYRMLILQHPETFFPIVEAIGECSAYHDLDIVPITFPFWMRLALSIGKKPSVSPLFLDAYRSLMRVMIKHLYFPEDPSKMSPQEADDFRSFRHVIGDTLKDCCYVLGTESCLTEVLNTLTNALTEANAGKMVSWQEIEAPLFSLRSMGAEIDLSDDTVIPKIMDLMPLLPDHPRIKYSAIMVMSRYTEWTSRHPSYIPFQLQFISSGFQDVDSEAAAAASQAMVYLCLDCKKDMIPFLPQLHSFLTSLETKLIQDDRLRIYEAVAHVISAMPMEQAAASLKSFAVDTLSKIHALIVKNAPLSKADLQTISDGLENLEAMLAVVDTFGEDLPSACRGTCEESWSIFDALLSKFGIQYDIAERSTRVLRRGLRFFGSAALPIIPSIMSRMSVAFEATGFASYVWIAGKAISHFGEEDNTDMLSAIKDVFERSTSKMVSLLQHKAIGDIPDVIEDYLQMLLQLFEKRPDVFIESPAFPTAFRIAIVSLELVHSEIVYASLDLLRGIVTHDSLDPSLKNPPPKFPIYAAAIRQVVSGEGMEVTAKLLGGLVNDFPEATVSLVVTIFRMLAVLWPEQLLNWLPGAVNSVPMPASFGPAKQQLLDDVVRSINRSEFDKVKRAVSTFHRFAMKTKDRQRANPISGNGE